MPDVIPAVGDLIVISIVPNPSSSPLNVVAKIGNKAGSRGGHLIGNDSYEVNLDGAPPLCGVVDIKDFTWKHDTGRWERTSVVHGIGLPTRIKWNSTPDGALLNPQVDPRAAGK